MLVPPTVTEQQFVHLHNHTEYSMLDGAARIADLFTHAADMGMPALAATDHGNLFGAYEFWKAGQAAGVRPIVGMEAYLTPGTHRADRGRVIYGDGGRDDVSAGGAYTHMTLWAENNTGLHNLFRLASLASLEGFFYQGRLDLELLHTYGQGILGTTGCPSGEVQTRLRLGQYDRALAAAGTMRDILGAGNYYLELMDHGLHIERQVRDDLLRLARDLDLPLVATNDLHYVRADDHAAHAALLCVQSGKALDDPKRFKFDTDEFYLKSPAEMRRLWAELPQACDNTLAIAERCAVTFDEGVGTFMPRFPVPAGHDEASWFVHEVTAGLARRYPAGVPADRQARADYETGIILGKHYPSYFLVVADFIAWARENGIRTGPGRGSGAGSMCAYALGITGLDPIVHNLMFERFLNPERPSMPDFDIDFDERRRDEVIRYVTDKYGTDRVAQIVTYGTIKAKQAVKDSVRVLGLPYGLGDQITKIMPQSVMGKDAPLAAIFDADHPRHADAGQVKERYDNDADVRRVLDSALGLEGLKRQWGVHAAGIVMSSDPLLDVLPIMKREADGAIITQFDYPTCEALGLVKMDFLGLRNLTVIEDTLANIRANGQAAPVLEDLPLDDPLTFALLTKGETLGVFQLDGGPMRSLLTRVQPTAFTDISAVLALYRPGPMGVNAHIEYADRKNDRKAVVPIHPELAEPLADILDETYSVVVYQEQVVAIAQRVAGYTLGRADILRKAMGKKKKEVLDAEFEPFRDGMRANGYSDAAIKALWDVLVPFADYAFNRCVTGSTEVWLGASGSDSDGTVTVEELYRRLHVNLLPPRRPGDPEEHKGACLHCQREDRPAVWRGRCKACKSWWIKFRNSGLTALSLDADGRIRPRRIKDVHHNGTREVVKITLADGKSITTTANHRHMTPEGWREVSDLSVGDSLMVVGDDAQKSYLKYDYRLTRGEPQYAGARLPNDQRHGALSLGYVDGASIALREWTQTQVWECQAPGCTRSREAGDRIERAHLDGDRTNNDPANLRMLCASHHKQHDYEVNGRLRRWGVGKPAVPVQIISIEPAGVEEVYDLEMDAPEAGDSDGSERSWVGNGIITHNSHTASYGLIAYWTAYLKAHHTAEYMAALLTSVGDDKDRLAVYLHECHHLGVPILPPDVNSSQATFVAVPEGIRFGLAAVRNVGAAVVDALVGTREAKGKFDSLEDFLRKCPAGTINRKTMESLIKAGGFDTLGPRQGLLLAAEDLIASVSVQKKAEAVGQGSLFGDDEIDDYEVPPVEFDRHTRMALEREMLGLYVTDHPLRGGEERLGAWAEQQIAEVMEEGRLPEDAEVTLAGLVAGLAVKRSRRGDMWATITLEDLSGSMDCLVFPKTYAAVASKLAPDQVLAVTGKVSRRDETPVVFVDSVDVIDRDWA